MLITSDNRPYKNCLRNKIQNKYYFPYVSLLSPQSLEIDAYEKVERQEKTKWLTELSNGTKHSHFRQWLSGYWYINGSQNIFEVETVDTTAAGDTFLGYFIQEAARAGAEPSAPEEAIAPEEADVSPDQAGNA